MNEIEQFLGHLGYDFLIAIKGNFQAKKFVHAIYFHGAGFAYAAYN